jgi:predicted porin
MQRLTFIAGALAALVSSVQAQNANVTLYGVADAYLSFAKQGAGASNGATASLTRIESGGIMGSRWGIRGSEQIGGLNANFTLENGFNQDTGVMAGGLMFGRKAVVGLSGGFGAIDLGRNYSPAFYNVMAKDLLGLGNWSVVSNIALGPFVNDLLRINNSITYTSPAFAGMTASAMYGLGEAATATSNANTGSLFQAGFNGAWGVASGGANYAKRQAGASNLSAFAGASVGSVALQLVYNQNKAAVSGAKTNALVGNAVYSFGANRILASYGTLKQPNTKTGSIATFGFEHDLSKRTAVYSYFTQANRATIGNLAYTPAVITNNPATHKNESGNPRDIAFGMRHRF